MAAKKQAKKPAAAKKLAETPEFALKNLKDLNAKFNDDIHAVEAEIEGARRRKNTLKLNFIHQILKTPERRKMADNLGSNVIKKLAVFALQEQDKSAIDLLNVLHTYGTFPQIRPDDVWFLDCAVKLHVGGKPFLTPEVAKRLFDAIKGTKLCDDAEALFTRVFIPLRILEGNEGSVPIKFVVKSLLQHGGSDKTYRFLIGRLGQPYLQGDEPNDPLALRPFVDAQQIAEALQSLKYHDDSETMKFLEDKVVSMVSSLHDSLIHQHDVVVLLKAHPNVAVRVFNTLLTRKPSHAIERLAIDIFHSHSGCSRESLRSFIIKSMDDKTAIADRVIDGSRGACGMLVSMTPYVWPYQR